MTSWTFFLTWEVNFPFHSLLWAVSIPVSNDLPLSCEVPQIPKQMPPPRTGDFSGLRATASTVPTTRLAVDVEGAVGLDAGLGAATTQLPEVDTSSPRPRVVGRPYSTVVGTFWFDAFSFGKGLTQEQEGCSFGCEF